MLVIPAALYVEVAHQGLYAPICKRPLTLRHLWSANRNEEKDMSFLICNCPGSRRRDIGIHLIPLETGDMISTGDR